MSIFCIRAGCEIQLVSYGSKNVSQSLLVKPLVCTYTHNLKTSGHRVYGWSAYPTTAILSKMLFMWFRVALEIQLESYNPRCASAFLWYNIVGIYCKTVHASLFGVQSRITTKLTYLMTAYYTPYDSFTANDASFYNNKSWLGKLHVAVTFQAIVLANIKLLTGTTIILYEFAAKQQKGSIN